MKPKHRATSHNSHERWLVSYADFITLLFAFFVVMFSSARMDREKTMHLGEAIESAFQELGAFPTPTPHTGRPAGGTVNSRKFPSSSGELDRMNSAAPGLSEANRRKMDFAAIRDELEKALAPEIKRREVAVRVQPDGLIVSLREVGFYASGSAVIKPQAVGALSRVASVLREHDCAIRIEGHTDTVPIHNAQFASNWELSTARATELVKLLVERYGLSPEQLSAAGYAEYHPVASNATPEGQQMNRRVDFVIPAAAISATQIATAQAPSGASPAPLAATGTPR